MTIAQIAHQFPSHPCENMQQCCWSCFQSLSWSTTALQVSVASLETSLLNNRDAIFAFVTYKTKFIHKFSLSRHCATSCATVQPAVGKPWQKVCLAVLLKFRELTRLQDLESLLQLSLLLLKVVGYLQKYDVSTQYNMSVSLVALQKICTSTATSP